ncbi:DNRLRE domain-containing protein (plasmid) [Arthrobacter agilis]|uniref:DNRLRE domain-containing protein n=1 Tax=Arthrobacter agilis TaxID=37921 RepID=UPI00236722AB|nr:DNRLRE domain-containing protein [Arthrobacter agilis]WDF35172.1 DNRLRE domain-containing protein [Arthrobacter agilis]
MEDLSQRTENTLVRANPDGTWALESYALPKFRQDEAGEWLAIDEALSFSADGTSLVGPDTTLDISEGTSPTTEVAELATLSGAGDDAGEEFTLGWEGSLPAPVLKGSSATYSDTVTVPIVDDPATTPPTSTPTAGPKPSAGTTEPVKDEAPAEVRVEATRTGFSHFVTLDEAPDGELNLRFPLDMSEGMTASINDAGTIEIKDADGELSFYAPKPSMWDAKINKNSGLPENEAFIDAELIEEDGKQVLVLPADEAWLNAPERTYPVTIDPTWSSPVSADTWIQSDFAGVNGGSPELRSGTFNGGGVKARSLLRFPTSALTGKAIVDATLQINSYHSWSCTAATTNVQRLTSGFDPATVTWSNQPAATATGQGSYSGAKGFSSTCPGGDVIFPMTSIVQSWADNASTNHGVRILAANEADSNAWRRYRSSEYIAGDNAAEPHLRVTYNSYPNTPTSWALGTGQGVQYKDPATGVTTNYSRVTRPSASAIVSDPDGGTVRVALDVFDGSTLLWDKVRSDLIASGGRATAVPATTRPELVNGKTYTAKLWAGDNSIFSKSSLNFNFVVDSLAPAAPAVTASGVANNGWADTKPANNTFTFTSSVADTVKFQYSKDGAAFVDLAATGTTTKTATLAWAPDGAHELRVRAVDKATNVSATTTFKFGFGGAALTAPKTGASSTDTFQVKASSPAAGSGTVTPKIYYRAAGTANGASFSTTNGSAEGWTLAETLPAAAAGAPVLVDKKLDATAAATAIGKTRIPALLDVQVCFTYTSPALTRCTWTQKPETNTSVLRLPHAFGNGYPVAEAGPGQAALYTGELNLSETDVSVDAGGSGLTVSRVYSSLSGSGAETGAFGPGWRPSFSGPDAGLAGYLVADTTGVDGTVSLIGDDESAMVFRQPGATKVTGKTGVYEPVNDEAVDSGLKLEVTGTGTTARINVTEDDGTITLYLAGSLDGNARLWDAEKVVGPASSGTVTFTRDAEGRVIRILAPVEEGTTCPTTGALAKGCRALNITYTATTTEGKIAGQVDKIAYTAWDPATSAMATVPVADYRYDTTGKLTTITNPRTGFSTTYTYGTATTAGVPTLTSITESGQAPYKFSYGAGAATTRSDWIETVLRGNPTGTGADVQIARFAYGVKVDGGGTNLPNLRTTDVELWDQAKAPVTGAAVFGADKPVTTSNAANISAADYRYASMQYWDAEGYTVNEASYGAGDWQISATDYDTESKPVRSFTPLAIAQIRELARTNPESVTNGIVGNHNEFATITRYTTNAGGSFPTDVWSPVAPAGADGTPSRTHTRNVYTPVSDIDSRTDKPRMLVLETITTEASPTEGTTDPAAVIATNEPVLTHVRNGYDAPGSTDKSAPTSGWIHSTPTTVTTVMGGSTPDITAKTTLDAKGRVVTSSQPASNGADAGTTRTTFYTAAAQTEAPACGNKPEWAGLPCAATPAGTGAVTSTTTSYNLFLQPTRVVETGGTATRTTDTTYLSDGRTDTEKTTTTGLTGSTAVPTTKHVYSTVSGLETETFTTNASGQETSRISWKMDAWSRTTEYKNAGGEITTTAYTPTGQVATVTTPFGTTTYTYDGADATGKEEHRGLPVTMNITNHGPSGTTGTYKASYDAAGSLTLQTMPGGISQKRSYDQAGRPEGLSYDGQTTTTSNGTTSTTPGPWVAWTQTRNALGQVDTETTPDGILLETDAAAYQREFSYDRAGRLTTVKDRTTDPGSILNTDPTEGTVTGCTTRNYVFDVNGNRTGLNTATSNADGSCSTAPGSAKAWSYDAADRVLTGANNSGTYVYDGLGRQTTVPASDAPATSTTAAGTGNITISYYDTEEARTITRNGQTTTFGIDATGRRLNIDNGTTTKINGYADTSDNPAWATTRDASGNITRTRYESAIGGDLAVIVDNGIAKLSLLNPHEDTVATVQLPTTGGATGIESWANYDEYGAQTGTEPATGTNTYAWHGGAERALDASGLVLMGARLYNSVTGLFTSRDPITGGNTTSYVHPQDPVNANDTTGELIWFAPVVWFGVRTIATYAVRYYAKKQVFRAANVARAAIRSNSTRQTSRFWYGRNTTAMAGRIFTGRRATYTQQSGWVSHNGLRGYRPATQKSHGGFRANFQQYTRRPTSKSLRRYPNNYSNYHVKIRRWW